MPCFTPQNERQIIDFLTGIFEGGTYCTIADNPADTQGGLSYGKHQAAEMQGGLFEMLKMYVDRATPPLPGPAFRSELEAHLQLYDPAGRLYRGTVAQRVAYKRLLRTICNDPAMQSTQDDFFNEQYYVPAMRHALDYSAATPLAHSIFYDIAIQAGTGRRSFFRSALARWSSERSYPACTACQSKDPNGPDEPTFLRYVNAARRAEMLGSSSPAYRATVYRPNEYDKLIQSGNWDFKRDFVFRGCHIKALL